MPYTNKLISNNIYQTDLIISYPTNINYSNPNMRNFSNIYILQLHHNKYYIGRTYRPIERIQEHQSNSHTAAKWVNKWGFKQVIRVFPEYNYFEEDFYTKVFMHKFGIENVRGGTYFSPLLTYKQLHTLQNEFDSALHKCFRCGSNFSIHHRCSFKTKDLVCYYCLSIGHRTINCPKILNKVSHE